MPIDFKKLIAARFFYTLAVQMQAIILGWRVYQLLKDPLALGFIGLSEAIPALGIAIFAGYLVDRMRPLLIYRAVIIISLFSGVLVLCEHIFESQLLLKVQVGLLYGAAFLTGLARAFSQPSIFAIIPRIVPRSKWVQATATSSSFMQIARISGPALGGIIFGFMGPITASAMVCLFLFISICCSFLIQIQISAPVHNHKHKSISEELFSGVRFVFGHPILLPAMSLDMISVLFGGVTALLPIFANEVLFIGAKGLGLLRAAPAVGATIMGLYLSKNQIKGNSGIFLLSAVAGFGFCILIFGASTNIYLSFFALVLSGAFDSVSMVIRSSAVQLCSPDHMRGKISAVNSIFIGSSNEIGELESGIAAKILGLVPSVYFGGFMCILTACGIAYLSPALRNLDTEKLSID